MVFQVVIFIDTLKFCFWKSSRK